MHPLVLLTGLAISAFAHANHHEGHAKHDSDRRDGGMHPLFSQFDKNKDGKLSHEEVEEGMKKRY